MSFRIWLFVAGLLALGSIIAAAYGAHGLDRSALPPNASRLFDTAQLLHMVHAIALFGIATLLATTDERRNGWAEWMLQIAALAFLAGTVLFSGGIYYHVLRTIQPSVPIVPIGGVTFMIGWAAVSLSAFGFGRSAK